MICTCSEVYLIYPATTQNQNATEDTKGAPTEGGDHLCTVSLPTPLRSGIRRLRNDSEWRAQAPTPRARPAGSNFRGRGALGWLGLGLGYGCGSWLAAAGCAAGGRAVGGVVGGAGSECDNTVATM
jgi:hypothetical protein